MPLLRGVRSDGVVQGGMPADFRREDHGLTKLRVARRNGVVFGRSTLPTNRSKTIRAPTCCGISTACSTGLCVRQRDDPDLDHLPDLTAGAERDATDSALASGAGSAGGWDARLALAFRHDTTRTVVTRREHRGPLVVQKPLHPEGPDVCQCIVVHPPAGIAAGDRLALDVDVGHRAWAQLTTPGAAKWYRSCGAAASQELRASVGENAVLEWLPQGTIVYDGARARSETRIALARNATFIGADVVCLGRRASGERFRRGEWRQRLEIVRDAVLIWSERAVLDPKRRLLASPVGLYDAPVFGTFVAVGTRIDDATLPALRDIAPAQGDGAVTQFPDVVVARYRGDSMEAASAYFAALWSRLRPVLTGRAAVRPRIWST